MVLTARQVSKLEDADATVKIGDFGLATEVRGFLHEVVGSDIYHAPEMFTSKGLVGRCGQRRVGHAFIFADPIQSNLDAQYLYSIQFNPIHR